MQVYAYVGIILCLAVNTHTRSVKETVGETVVKGRIPMHTSSAKAEENPELLADFCTPNPCKNGAECLKSSKKCSCKPGYSGVYCETCKCTKGFCKENSKGISKCRCPSEFGKYSTTECRECQCGKGANCTFYGDHWSTTIVCLCKVGYEDENGVCKGTCKNNPCQNNGECVVNGNDIQCNCKSPFTGEFCEENELCIPNPCKNGGACSASNGKVACLCKDPYTGDNCATNLCNPNPCKNGGMCSASNGKVTCQCKDPYTGDNCTTEIPFSSTTTPEEITNVTLTDSSSGGPTRNLFTTFPPRPSTVDDLNKNTSWINLNSTTVFPRNISTPISTTERFSRDHSLNFTRERGSTVQLSTATASTVIDLCEVNPCKNGGICRMEGNTARCYCVSPFTGKLCEKEIPSSSTTTPEEIANITLIDSSSEGPSRNLFTTFPPRPSTVDDLNKTTSWININSTTVFPKNISTPISTTERFSRDHSLNITRERGSTVQLSTATASTAIDLCEVNPCKNGGICRMEGNTARCYCVSPFTGKLCEKDPCFLNPCVNGGQCKVNGTSFQCKCGLPYSGRFCENDPCSENPCKNGGECFVTGDSFKCLCKAPYAGILCETDPCVWNPCKNGGICKIEFEAARCFCKEPFTGEFCDSLKNFDTYVITPAAASGILVIVVILLSCLLCRRYSVGKTN